MFKLEHPFKRTATANDFAEGDLRDNLMEYYGGTSLVKLQWDAIHHPGTVIGIFERDEDAMYPRTTYASDDILRFINLYKCAIGSGSYFSFYQPGYPNNGILSDNINIDNKQIGVTIIISEDLVKFKPVKNAYTFNQSGNMHIDFGKFSIGVSGISRQEFISYLESPLSNSEISKAINDIRRLRISDKEKSYELLYHQSNCLIKKLTLDEKKQILEEFSNETYLEDYKDHIVISILESIAENKEESVKFYDWLRPNPKIVINLYRGVDDEATQTQYCNLLAHIFNHYFTVENLSFLTGKDYFIVDEQIKTYIKSQIHTENLSITQILAHVKTTNNRLNTNPMEPLGVWFTYKGSEDELYFFPAIYLHNLVKETNLKNTKEFLIGSLHLVSTFYGYGLLTKGHTIFKIIGAVEMANATTNLTLQSDEIRQKFLKTPEGQKFLELWPTISITADIVTLTTFIASANKLKNVIDDLPVLERKSVYNQIEKAKKMTLPDNVMPVNFFENVNDLAATFDQYKKLSSTIRGDIFNYYKQQKWEKLEAVFKEYKLNGGWPPANGGYNIIDDIHLYKGMKLDRYQDWFQIGKDGNPIFGGSFTSPIIGGKPYSYSKRALKISENNNALYYEIEILKDLPIKGQSADVIPWFGREGGGKQIMFKFNPSGQIRNFQDLIDQGYIKITIKTSPNGKYNKWIGNTFLKKN